jgi:hypothetical protein
MKYVYMLECRGGAAHFQICPWRLKTYLAFSDEKRALEFGKYLKSGSGRAFAKKRL